jgi:hypothetical protein
VFADAFDSSDSPSSTPEHGTMGARLTKAVMTLCVAWPRSDAGGRTSSAAVDRVLDLLAKHELSATWALLEPAGAAAGATVVLLRAGHEVALLGEAGWAGRHTARLQFGRELAQRTAAAQNQGLSITTLVLDGETPDGHGDLAVRHGITAVVHPASGATPRGSMQPRTMRFGLWSFPVSHELPGHSRWLPGGGGARGARSLIERAIASHGLVALVIDVPRLEQRGHAAERVLNAVLTHARWRQQQGTLEVMTINAAAAALAQQRQSVPSQSILRSAA